MDWKPGSKIKDVDTGMVGLVLTITGNEMTVVWPDGFVNYIDVRLPKLIQVTP